MTLDVTSYRHRELEFQVWKGFLRELKRSDEQELLEAIFEELFKDPLRGDLLAGGLRKARIGSRRKKTGKRGGYRYLYYLKTQARIYLIALLNKREAENFSKPFLDAAAELIKGEKP